MQKNQRVLEAALSPGEAIFFVFLTTEFTTDLDLIYYCVCVCMQKNQRVLQAALSPGGAIFLFQEKRMR
jgi:hypothetical protein